MNRFLWQVPQKKRPCIDKLDVIEHPFIAASLALKGERYLKSLVLEVAHLHIEIDLQVGIFTGATKEQRRIGTLEGEVLYILAKNINLRVLSAVVRLG